MYVSRGTYNYFFIFGITKQLFRSQNIFNNSESIILINVSRGTLLNK